MACWQSRPSASLRESLSIWVYWVTSPPPRDLMPAMKFTPIARLRTVRPKTSPNTWVTRQPGTSFMVEIRMGNCGGALGWDMFPDRRRALSLSDSVFGARCPTVTSVSDDVLVIGAGVIGLTTAVCLAEAGVR